MASLWQMRVASSVMLDDATPPAPRWSGNVPWCDDDCPHHDGKRCRLLGSRPDNLCEPVVEAMGAEIARSS